jgi:hypothetical protein
MKSDLYLKVPLTIIAACLVALKVHFAPWFSKTVALTLPCSVARCMIADSI